MKPSQRNLPLASPQAKDRPSGSPERLQKILSQVGVASRRGAEDLIRQGLVTVNGKVAQLGEKAIYGKDAIKVSGKLLVVTAAKPIYLAFYKPKGVISMFSNNDNRASLKDFFKPYFLKDNGRLFPIGRLEFNTEGLMLLTNEGGFAERLQKDGDLTRRYEVKVKGHLEPEHIKKLQKGAFVGDGTRKKRVRPESVEILEELQAKTLVQVTLRGPGGDLRALFDLLGFLVDKMTRVAIGPVEMGDLPIGMARPLKKSELSALGVPLPG